MDFALTINGPKLHHNPCFCPLLRLKYRIYIFNSIMNTWLYRKIIDCGYKSANGYRLIYCGTHYYFPKHIETKSFSCSWIEDRCASCAVHFWSKRTQIKMYKCYNVIKYVIVHLKRVIHYELLWNSPFSSFGMTTWNSTIICGPTKQVQFCKCYLI